jgi:hypothetical protein
MVGDCNYRSGSSLRNYSLSCQRRDPGLSGALCPGTRIPRRSTPARVSVHVGDLHERCHGRVPGPHGRASAHLRDVMYKAEVPGHPETRSAPGALSLERLQTIHDAIMMPT